jgi:hypothetical protein
MELIAATGDGPRYPDCYDLLLATPVGHRPFSATTPFHGLACAIHLTFAAVNSLTDVTLGLLVGIIPSFHGHSIGARNELFCHLYDSLNIVNLPKPHNAPDARTWNKSFGIQMGTYNSKVLATMFCAISTEAFQYFYDIIARYNRKCHANPFF